MKNSSQLNLSPPLFILMTLLMILLLLGTACSPAAGDEQISPDGDTDQTDEEAPDPADGDLDVDSQEFEIDLEVELEAEQEPDLNTGILNARVPSTGAFPYVFEDDDPVYDDPELAFLLYRAEGRPLEETYAHAWDYLQKFEFKKYSAPSAELAWFERQGELFEALKSAEATEAPDEAVSAVALGLLGDIMWIRNSWSDFLDSSLLDFMRGFDFFLGNLESPIAQSLPVPDDLPSYTRFNSHPDLIRSFAAEDGASLFQSLSFANNHTLDMEDLGAEETLDFLADEGILSAGARKQAGKRWTTFEQSGIRFGFYAACWGLNDPELLQSTGIEIDVVDGLAPPGEKPIDLDDLREVLGEMAAEGVDFKIVTLHWGHEYELYPSPLQMVAAREIVHAGADLILGHHPHVQQPPEICFVNGYANSYLEAGLDLPAFKRKGGCVLKDEGDQPRKALVLYSMGNFSSTMGTNLCNLGLLARLQVFKNEAGDIDWRLPALTFVYNVRKIPPDESHKLLLLDDFLDSDCALEEEEGCSEKLQSDIAYMREHLFGLDAGE